MEREAIKKIASALAKARWAKTTLEERQNVGRELVKARRRKARRGRK